jgi:glutaredoxin
MSKAILYSTGCPKCQVLTKKLERIGIDFEVCEDMDKITTLCDYLGATSIPILEIDNQYLDFNNAIKWVGEQTNAN